MRFRILATTAVLTALAMLGAAPGSDVKAERKAASTRPADGPCVVVRHDGGYRRNPNSGLKLAVWADGTILFSPHPERLGVNLLVGKVDKADVEAMQKAVREAGIFDAGRSYVVPDSSYTTILVQDAGKSANVSWHESLLPGFGGDINTDAKYRTFVKTWKRTMGAIESLAPVEVHRLSDQVGKEKVFRGYVID